MEIKQDIKLPEIIYVNPRRKKNKMTPQFDVDSMYEAHSEKVEGFVKYKKVTEEKKGN